MIPRDPARDHVECVAYAGNPHNLAGSASAWSSALNRKGIEFRCLGPDSWNDCSRVDILVGVRSFSKSRHKSKPASKLVNAWHARIPLIGGFDSAFEQIGRPGRDYIRVRSLDDAVEAICKLRDDRDLYRSIVDSGAARVSEYSSGPHRQCLGRLAHWPDRFLLPSLGL